MWLSRIRTLFFSFDSLYSIISWSCAVGSIYALNKINKPLTNAFPEDSSAGVLTTLLVDVGLLTAFFLCFGIRKAPNKNTPQLSLAIIPANLASLVISALIFLAIPLDWLFSITSAVLTPILAICLILVFLLVHHVINEVIIENRLPSPIRHSITLSTTIAYIFGLFLISIFFASNNDQFSIEIPSGFLMASHWLLINSFDFALEHL